MKSATLCEHANENPAKCPCPNDCYCKAHTCKSSVNWSEIEGSMHRLWGNASSGDYDKQAWIRFQVLLGQLRRETTAPPPEEPLKACIEFEYNRRGGSPVIAGTRFTLAQVVAELAEGNSLNELTEDVGLPQEQVREALFVLSGFLEKFQLRSKDFTFEVRAKKR